jgi:chemotaxis protein methyltransferase CheR
MQSALTIPRDLDYAIFVRRIREKTGVDLSCYKRPQMERRLWALAQESGARSFAEFARMLETSPDLLEAFRRRFTINVSELFRDPQKFHELETRILPELLAQTARPRVWSAGCSYGAEAYSLAILLHERLGPAGAYVLATDIDEEMLERAREGVFSAADLQHVSAVRQRRWFTAEARGYRVRPELRRAVRFQRHDLLSDRFEKGFHLILCRNVVIYFTDEAKARLYRAFWESLVPGGVLFVGATERIFEAREIGFEQISPFFYRRT